MFVLEVEDPPRSGRYRTVALVPTGEIAARIAADLLADKRDADGALTEPLSIRITQPTTHTVALPSEAD